MSQKMINRNELTQRLEKLGLDLKGKKLNRADYNRELNKHIGKIKVTNPIAGGVLGAMAGGALGSIHSGKSALVGAGLGILGGAAFMNHATSKGIKKVESKAGRKNAYKLYSAAHAIEHSK